LAIGRMHTESWCGKPAEKQLLATLRRGWEGTTKMKLM